MTGSRHDSPLRRRLTNFRAGKSGRRSMVGLGVVGLVVGLLWAGHEAHLYTESVPFCGLTCHRSMAPEYSAHRHSRHARVSCVECHVGSGMPARIRSKLEGAQRIWATFTEEYSRPIHVSTRDSRPTGRQCKKCHEFSRLVRPKPLRPPRYRQDRQNSHQPVTVVLKGNSQGGAKEARSIWWHMTTASTIRFRAMDQGRQEIPWVRVRTPDGRETTYTSRVSPLSREKMAKLPRHEMECVDCHNRLAHASLAPDAAVDQALNSGELSSALPSIKKVTMEAITAEYMSREAAHHGIRHAISNTYLHHYPQIFSRYPAEIEGAIKYALAFYDQVVFPELGVDWRTYPDQLGHRFWPGCFRCHDGRHVSADGKVLPSECGTVCHSPPTLEGQSATLCADMTVARDWHPWQSPIQDLPIEGHERLLCSDCHGAGRIPKRTCDDCHGQVL